MAHVVILNGPPGCGKDTLANILAERGFNVLQFKDGLYEATAENYGMTVDYVKALCTDRGLKEHPCPSFGGLTPRQALIHVSEDIWKPQYGVRVFGERLAESAFKCGHVIVPDGGFKDELNAVEASHLVTVVRLHRDGYTFEGDSRTYAEDSWTASGSTHIVDLHLEDGEIDKAVQDLLKLIG